MKAGSGGEGKMLKNRSDWRFLSAYRSCRQREKQGLYQEMAAYRRGDPVKRPYPPDFVRANIRHAAPPKFDNGMSGWKVYCLCESEGQRMLSIEVFAAVNMAMNMAVFGVSARLTGHVRWRRVWLASAAGTGYAAAAYAGPVWLRGPTLQLICMALLSLILSGGHVRRVGRNLTGTALAAALAGGVMTLLAERIPSGGLLTAVGWPLVWAAALLTDFLRMSRGSGSCIRLRIGTRMGKTEVEAMIDTGNRLHEPLSGLPVVIVGRKQLKGVLDERSLYGTENRLMPGFRLIRYGTIGGSGEMKCFRPESVWIMRNGVWQEGPDIWIGIYPGELPSALEAIAPPVG